jgi:hypothetical protein
MYIMGSPHKHAATGEMSSRCLNLGSGLYLRTFYRHNGVVRDYTIISSICYLFLYQCDHLVVHDTPQDVIFSASDVHRLTGYSNDFRRALD